MIALNLLAFLPKLGRDCVRDGKLAACRADLAPRRCGARWPPGSAAGRRADAAQLADADQSAARAGCAGPGRAACQHHRGAAHVAAGTESAGGSQGQLSLAALLTEESQIIQQGLVWRVFREKAGGRRQGRARLHAPRRQPDPATGARHLPGQRRLRPRAPDPQDHGVGRAGGAGALRAQRRRPARGCRCSPAARQPTRGPSASRCCPTSATSTGSAPRS